MATTAGFGWGGRVGLSTVRSNRGTLNSNIYSSKGHGIRGRVTLSMSQSSANRAGDEQGFDTANYDAERLRLDAETRANVAAVAVMEQERSGPGAWKWAIRKRIWDALEAQNVAEQPRPVHHRIPNFKGAAAAADRLARLPEFQAARCVKVNPDTPQKQVRFLTLSGGKTLLTPQPRLRTGFFSTLEAADLPAGVQIIEACTSAGAAKHGTPVGLDAPLRVDLIVIGSVAVDPSTGARLGKGEGFAELEYGMLRYMGAIDDNTLVVTSVHDLQVVEEGTIPTEKLLIHDVPVDVICTPTRTIFTNTSIPKPKGIYWEVLSPQKLEKIRVLQVLKKMIEEKTNQVLPSGPDEVLPPTAARKNTWRNTRRSSANTRR
ncbi:5-formyltetrahydrofolate cyclo-ligase [Marchantia polymorpha subsp. ruderalis]|uniref:5-formyltetrahydrofolate cyclo-ligase n=2 Tax=Marchantia polymorpha TaxID=3197 RepID=A0AAF6AWR7_MARPO|nr:hypothetical protein MARPO_0007s0250 [Marchantia polymorpha]BBN04201.1 hypothetical protein Mp_3g02610 [Marchantia polymorpha subsp. ruderalis]|eukprot:PTQ47887.1 hypothetical protein MARPO_0007s0250 [Marchantia polymorpha]